MGKCFPTLDPFFLSVQGEGVSGGLGVLSAVFVEMVKALYLIDRSLAECSRAWRAVTGGLVHKVVGWTVEELSELSS